MQHSSGAGGGDQYHQSPPPTHSTTLIMIQTRDTHDQAAMVAEEASPISSRPPAITNLDEFMRLSQDAFGGAASGSGSGGGGNRWPREETLALLRIRSEMDAAFRDAIAKGPLWEDVSRKLAELGYKRSAKKCKEKFENVQKYYKRTKDGKAGRQDGKSYKFFSQLEAFRTTNTATEPSMQPPQPPTTMSVLDVPPVSIGILPNMPGLSSVTIFSTTPPGFPGTVRLTDPTVIADTTPIVGGAISFSMDECMEDEECSSEGVAGSGKKRKREEEQDLEGSKGDTQVMMEFFERLMRQVLQKQESMQQRLLEVIEKTEQDRVVKEEAWKMQETARLRSEHVLMAQERASSASRDAAIVSLLQKITGQTIQLPSITVTTFAPPPPLPPPPPGQLTPLTTVSTQPPPSALTQITPSQIQQAPPPPQKHDFARKQHNVHHYRHRSSISSDVTVAITEQELVSPSEGHEPPSSSRWPKEEIIALINVRTGLESRYQETGPKGPLWEEVSARMNQIGYTRNAKRCKEKWENINKYYKKVKESIKKRREDSKTCLYYHELDKLYSKRMIGNGTSDGSSTTHNVGPVNLNPNPNPNQPMTDQQRSNVPSMLDGQESNKTNSDDEDDDGEIEEEDDDDNNDYQERNEIRYKTFRGRKPVLPPLAMEEMERRPHS